MKTSEVVSFDKNIHGEIIASIYNEKGGWDGGAYFSTEKFMLYSKRGVINKLRDSGVIVSNKKAKELYSL